MADEELEVAKIKKVGVLSLAITIGLITLFANILFSIILYFVLPVLIGLLPFVLPFQISTKYLIFYCIGSTVVTFISSLILGLFYNLSALITKGIKLYS